MKISDYKVGTEFEITCAKVNKRLHGEIIPNEYIYDSFGISQEHPYVWARKPEEVIKVKCTIIEEDVVIADIYKNKDYDSNCIDYFGFILFKDDGTFDISMIYPNIKTYSICFPYGADAERFWSQDIKINEVVHHAGDRRAMSVRLKVEPLDMDVI